MNTERIKKYFTSDDIQDDFLMENAFSDPANEKSLFNILSDQWDEINVNKKLPEVNLKHLLFRLHYHINMTSAKASVPVTLKIYTWYAKIAAVLLIPLLIASMLFISSKYNHEESWSELRAPKGEKAQFILPDGSKGFLNSGSSLRYYENFNKKRLVQLEGEGFFDVIKNEKKPFTILTSELTVTVLGTRFNICAYNEEKAIRTTLESGSIKIGMNKLNKYLILMPGEQNIYYRDTKTSIINKVNTDLYTSWKESKLRFDDASFIDIIKKMERWYDVKINLDDEIKYTQRYTMTIKTESLKEMLDLLSVTAPINYKIKNDNVFITLKN